MMRSLNRTGFAITSSLLALAVFGSMDLIIKLLSSNFSVAEISTWRNLFGLIPAFFTTLFV